VDRVETLETWSKVIFVLILVLMALAITVITLREREASRAVSTQRLGRIWRLAASAAAERQAAAAYKAAASRHPWDDRQCEVPALDALGTSGSILAAHA
jgi:hypothetical protein